MPSARGALYGFYTKMEQEPEQKPVLSLDLYFKQEPDIATYLPGIASIKQIDGFNGTRTYRVHPGRRGEPHFRILKQSEQTYPSIKVPCLTSFDDGDDISDIVEDAEVEKLTIPIRFLDNLFEGGLLIADEQLYRQFIP